MEACTRTSRFSDFESEMRCKLVNKAFIAFRTIKIYYDIIDPKITKNLSNRLYQPRPHKLKIEPDVIDKPVKLVIR